MVIVSALSLLDISELEEEIDTPPGVCPQGFPSTALETPGYNRMGGKMQGLCLNFSISTTIFFFLNLVRQGLVM